MSGVKPEIESKNSIKIRLIKLQLKGAVYHDQNDDIDNY